MIGSARDVVILGAGVIGTAIAYALSQERLKVAVLDPQPMGSGCTFHGTALVWKMIWNDTTQYQLAMEGREYILQNAYHVIPDLRRAEVVYHLAGSRPLSADGLPIIGPVPHLEGAYIATGHRNKGIHLSTVTAALIRDFVTTGASGLRTPVEKFLPGRFADQPHVEFKVEGVTV